MMRRVFVLSAVLTSATCLAAGIPAMADSTAAAGLEGVYRLVATESASPGEHAQDRHLIIDARGRATDVTLPAGLHPRVGSVLRLKGKMRLDGKRVRFAANGVTVVAAAPKVAAATTPTVSTTTVPTAQTAATVATTSVAKQRVLVLLATWTTPDLVTPASAREQFFGVQDAWFTQASHGRMGLTGDVTAWLSIPGPTDGRCFANMQQTMDQAKAAALLQGFDASAYDRAVLYFPKAPATADCAPFEGWAFQPGNVMWLNGTMDAGVALHEQGHNLGLGHAFAWGCMEPTGVTATLTGMCDILTYGDTADVMGRTDKRGFFSASRMAGMGWFGTGQLSDLSAGGQVTLMPFEGQAGPLAVKVVAGSRTYWVEYRVGAGLNATTPVGTRNGALLHLGDGTRLEAGLLDMTPDDRTFETSVLAQGMAWTSPEGVRITVGTDAGAGLPITVSRPTAPSAPASLQGRWKASLLSLTWQGATDGGTAVTAYVVEGPNGLKVSLPSAARSYSAGALTSGSYLYTVRAVNAVGAGLPASTTAVKR